MKKVAFITLGCKVNQYETNAMTQKFINKGYKIVEENEIADIYIINTCTVTNMSDRKSRQMIRRVEQLNEKAIVVACGCYVQVAKDDVKEIDGIDLVLGNDEKKNIVEYVEKYIEDNKKEVKVQDLMKKREYIDFGEVTYTEKTRAVIKIQDGCDMFCTYCIIPFARGRVRSREKENIISEIKKIAKNGIKEIVLTGIHIASYGKDFDNGYKLIDLLEDINKIEGIQRIRLGSLEPLIMTEEFLVRLSKLDKICHHFHLSLQSGCDETLSRMNRRYRTEEFKKIVTLIRKYYSDVNLTTDIIVGFPGETDEEFNKTFNFLEEIKFYKMHIFKYSPRKGTKAAEMKNQVSGEVKEKRSRKLIELSNKYTNEYNKKYLDEELEVLFEEEKEGYYLGHTGNYILVKCRSNIDLSNELIRVKCYCLEDEAIIAKTV